jgi:hypothetical protein
MICGMPVVAMSSQISERLKSASAGLDSALDGMPMLLKPAAGPIGSVCRQALEIISEVNCEIDQLNQRLEVLENGYKK